MDSPQYLPRMSAAKYNTPTHRLALIDQNLPKTLAISPTIGRGSYLRIFCTTTARWSTCWKPKQIGGWLACSTCRTIWSGSSTPSHGYASIEPVNLRETLGNKSRREKSKQWTSSLWCLVSFDGKTLLSTLSLCPFSWATSETWRWLRLQIQFLCHY